MATDETELGTCRSCGKGNAALYPRPGSDSGFKICAKCLAKNAEMNAILPPKHPLVLEDRVGTLSPDSSEAEVDAVLLALPFLSPFLQEKYKRKVANLTKTTLPTIEKQFRKLVDHSHPEADPDDEGKEGKDCPFTPEELRSAETFGGIDVHAQPLKWMRNVMDLMHKGDASEKMVVALLCQGIYLGHTFSLAVRGDTQAGKTNLAKSALRFIRKEDYDMKVSATGAYLRRKLEKAEIKLFYLCEMAGINKEDGDAVNIIKMLSSDDRGGSVGLCDKAGDQWEPVDLPMPKDLSFMTTYAGSEIDSQLESRMWIVECNMAKAHNVEVNQSLLRPEDERATNEQNVEVCCAAWQAITGPAYQEAASLDVFIPFKPLLEKMFPVRNNPTPRDIQKFLHLLKIITKIHHALMPASRAIVEIDGRSYLVAEPVDLRLAAILGQGIIQERMEHLTETDVKILKILGDLKLEQEANPPVYHKPTKGLFANEQVAEQPQERGYTPKDIYARGGFTTPQYVYRRMRNLYVEGYLVATDIGSKGRVKRYDLDEDMAGSRARGLGYEELKAEVEECTSAFLASHDMEKTLAEEYDP